MPSPERRRPDRLCALWLIAMAAVAMLRAATSDAAPATAASPPRTLRETGLYLPGAGLTVDPAHLEFSPQYPLWTDGANKRRWLSLPTGTFIDATRPNAWEFPVGTRLWKEFSIGRAIETRYLERLADGSWRYAAYVWNEAGTDAVLAPAEGVRALAVEGAPGGRYTIPGEADCQACHEGAAVPVLGFSALQLSPDRDPLAPHADALSPVDLETLLERGLVRNLPPALLANAPRITASTPVERAALGYLHGNCSHCHNDDGSPVPVDVRLSQNVSLGAEGAQQVLQSLIDAPSRFRAAGLPHDARVLAPGRPEASTLLWRLRSTNPQTRMPPLGVQLPDEKALALIERWIAERSSNSPEYTP